MVSINDNCAFSRSSENILLVTEVLLHAAVVNFAQLKNLWWWSSLNAILLPPLLTKAVVLDGHRLATDQYIGACIGNRRQYIRKKGLK